jgi:hypothetical protein
MIRYGIHWPTNLRSKPTYLLSCVQENIQRRGLVLHNSLGMNYKPCDFLFLYGWGGRSQQKILTRHKGDYAAFDLGYWNREGLVGRHWRVSINGFHSPELIMKGDYPRGDRLKERPIVVNGGKKDGPILLVGNSPKSQRVGCKGWSASKLAEIRKVFPDVRVVYKPKPGRPSERVQADSITQAPIEEVLRKVRMVVVKHSNVAVDAAFAGVPVVAESGAGAAIYPQRLQDYEDQPDIATRIEFLRRVAWWQWKADEIFTQPFVDWLEGRMNAARVY